MGLSKSELSARRDVLFDILAKRTDNPRDPLVAPDTEPLAPLVAQPPWTDTGASYGNPDTHSAAHSDTSMLQVPLLAFLEADTFSFL